MKKHLLLTLLALLPMVGSAYDAVIDGIYYNFSGDEATIIDCADLINAPGWQPFMNPLVIPGSISYNDKTYNVTSIGNNAFDNCEGLIDVIISNGITKIGNYAFNRCDRLTSITIPYTVTSIGYRAFGSCGSLADVYCYAEYLLRISEDAFEDSPIEDATLHVPAGTAELYRSVSPWEDFGTIVEMEKEPDIQAEIDGIYYILSGNKATVTYKERDQSSGYHISDYSGSIDIPKYVTYNSKIYSVTSIGEHAFEHCGDITSITIPNSVTSIGMYAFNCCTGLTSIIIPNNVVSIGKYAFQSCANLTSITLSENLTSIEEDIFIACTSLASVTIPNSVTSIGNGAFWACHSLTSVTIPNSLTTIGNNAFHDCYALKSITIPSSVASIGGQAFAGCYQMQKVIVSDIAAWCGISFGNDSDANPLYHAHHLYSDEETEITDLVIPDGVTSIGNTAFTSCIGLTSVTIPEGVTSIGELAFRECNGLQSVSISESVTSIGNYAFLRCKGLTDVTLPEKLITIGKGAFYECTGLTSITIPNSVNSIADYAFYYCSGLISVTIPEGVTSIGNDAFSGCEGLTDVTLPESLITLGHYAFDGCRGLTSIDIPNNVTSIGYSAFWGCSGLTSVTIGNSVTSIGNNAFGRCSGLTSVTIGNSVTSIDDYAFHECSGLTSVTIPNSVTSIGAVAFSGCSGLTSVTIGNGVTSIGYGAFSGCNNLSSIRILQETPIATDRVVCYDITYDTATLYIPVGSLEAYKADAVWSQFKNIRDILCFVNVTATDGGTLTFNGESLRDESKRVIIDQGTDVTFEVKPDKNYDFTSLKINGTTVTTRDGIYTLANLQSHINVVATFTEKPKFDIIATATGGTVSLNGATPSASQSINVYRDTDVTLTIKPNEGHELSKITVNGADVSSQLQDNTLKFENIQEAKNIVVTFTKYVFNVSVSGAGVSVSNTRPEYGDNVIVTIEDDPDRTLVSLLVNGQDVTDQVVDGQYVIQNVTSNITIEATFKSTKEFITMEGEYAMFSCPQDLDFTGSDLCAYIASGFNRNTNQVLLVRVYDVPACTGVFLIGESGMTYKIPYAETGSYYSNLFQANLEKSTIYATTGSYSNYIFSEQDDEPGFYPIIDYTTLLAQTAYLQLPTSFVAAGVKVSVIFEDDVIDGIEDFRISESDETIYDLAGRRLSKTQRGINIVNGKKILVK